VATVNQANAVWCCSKCGAVYHKDFPRCPNDGAEIVLTTGDPLIGKRIDNYVIDALVGEGGMGRVYRAHHANLPDKRYAIKVLLGDVAATASMRKRFVKEAEIASTLDHPNLVGVVDFGATPGGLPYIAMDFVDGEVLTAILDRAPMEWRRVVGLARSICEGLAYAHDAGLVHRDLKPDNVIVVNGPKGDIPRLTDFGLVLSQERTGEERLTSTGMAMGTPAYAAPEQMSGKLIDLRADLFALGMTIYEMLTGGKLPWEGTALEIATAKAYRDALPLAERAPEVKIPQQLEILMMRLLRRRRDERPDNARAVISILDQILNGSGEVTDQTPIIVKSRSVWWVPAIALALGAGALGWWAVGRSRANHEPIAQASPPPAKLEPAPTPPAPPPPPPKREEPVLVADAITAADPTADPAEQPAPAPRSRTKRKPTPRHVTVAKVDPPSKDPPPKDPPPKDPPPKDPLPVAEPPKDPLPAKPVELRASLVGVNVHGSLSEADVERAIRRTMPAIERCTPKQPERITAQLKIGEARRAENVEASGGSSSACVAAALGAVRTQSAPDVGDVTVIVQVAFVAKP
jgi:serine/threonine protein kinase